MLDSNVKVQSRQFKGRNSSFYAIFAFGFAVIFGIIALILHMNSPVTIWKLRYDSEFKEQRQIQYQESYNEYNKEKQKVRDEFIEKYTEPITKNCQLKTRMFSYTDITSLNSIFFSDINIYVKSYVTEYIQNVKIWAETKVSYSVDDGTEENVTEKTYTNNALINNFNVDTMVPYTIKRINYLWAYDEQFVTSLKVMVSINNGEPFTILTDSVYDDIYSSSAVSKNANDYMSTYKQFEFKFDEELAKACVISEIGECPKEDERTKKFETFFMIASIVLVSVSIFVFVCRLINNKRNNVSYNFGTTKGNKDICVHEQFNELCEDGICEYCLTRIEKGKSKCPNCGASKRR